MSPELAARLGEIAHTIRDALLVAAETSSAVSITFGAAALLESELAKPVRCGLSPAVRHPGGEVAWINFHGPRDVAGGLDEPIALIRDEIEPVVIGVGNVVTKDSPEGFVVFLADARKVANHDSSEIEITPEMIEAGAAEICGRYLDIRDAVPGATEEVVTLVYRAMRTRARQ